MTAFKTDIRAKWFNVFHIGLMIAAAVLLLISVMTKYIKIVFVWMTLYIIHMVSYYIVFNAMINVRNPFLRTPLSASIYVLVNVLTLGKVLIPEKPNINFQNEMKLLILLLFSSSVQGLNALNDSMRN
ncbi:hypothetical protein M5D96_010576 [Drosophila gunungcola]|uniref:Uncharacterized protein n=1 Tax=Drosophila gunungcola TaxID=103775 RepID=A0A9P9YGY7_9MUSC|nr:hypothetical protein M5D96_010576 [Drosophila gunungcola]